MFTAIVIKYLRHYIGGYVLQKLIEFFLSKKRIIQIVGSIALAGGAIAAGMKTDEVKEIVCGAPVIQVPARDPIVPAVPLLEKK